MKGVFITLSQEKWFLGTIQNDQMRPLSTNAHLCPNAQTHLMICVNVTVMFKGRVLLHDTT